MVLEEESVVGLDVGGANLKLASASGRASSISFPLWKQPEELHLTLQAQVDTHFPHAEYFGLTITGELADCYSTRSEGVERIVKQVQLAVPGRSVHVYCIPDGWRLPDAISGSELQAAASNWHCLAKWIASRDRFSAVDLLIDIGSTTVDVVPLTQRTVATSAATDRDRLQLSQLVYTGYERTPVASIVQGFKFEGDYCPVMAERFADSVDAYLALGVIEEDPGNSDTADGRPRTQAASRGRLARMIGEDYETLSAELVDSLAEQVVRAQLEHISRAATNSLLDGFDLNQKQPEACVMFTGHAKHLEGRVENRLREEQYGGAATKLEFRRLSQEMGEEISRSAPAFAAAELLREWLDGVDSSSSEFEA